MKCDKSQKSHGWVLNPGQPARPEVVPFGTTTGSLFGELLVRRNTPLTTSIYRLKGVKVRCLTGSADTKELAAQRRRALLMDQDTYYTFKFAAGRRRSGEESTATLCCKNIGLHVTHSYSIVRLMLRRARICIPQYLEERADLTSASVSAPTSSANNL